MKFTNKAKDGYFRYRIIQPKPGPFVIQYKARSRNAGWCEFATVHSYDGALRLLAGLAYGRSVDSLCVALGVKEGEV